MAEQDDSGYRRVDDLYVDYANNVYLESSVWDLKLIFGQLDQSTSPVTTEQRAALTIPWMQAKLLSYLLSVHVLAHETGCGKIAVPDAVLPPPITPPTEEAIKADPSVQEFYRQAETLYNQFLLSAK
jgi:hypothetical protein